VVKIIRDKIKTNIDMTLKRRKKKGRKELLVQPNKRKGYSIFILKMGFGVIVRLYFELVNWVGEVIVLSKDFSDVLTS